MTKLSDTQLIVLSQAAAQEDGFASPPGKLNKAAAAKVGASLVARKLMREMRAKPGQPVWREDAERRALCLVITKQGRAAIGVVDEAAAPAAVANPVEPAAANRNATATGLEGKRAGAGVSFREGSKSAGVVKMLSAPGGATLDALVDATGWLPHTARAALTGLRKRGFAIERSKEQGKVGVYRIPAPLAKNARSNEAEMQA